MATELATGYISLVPTTRGIQANLSRALVAPAAKAGGDAGRAAGEGMRSGIAGKVAGIGAMVGGAFAIGKTVGFAKDAVIGFNSTLQQSTIAFTTMLGSATKADSFVRQLQAFAAKTPFEFQGLVQNAQGLMGMGVAAQDVLPDLTALGDSVASVGGNATTLDNTISAFGQTMAKGTLDMGNMNQLLQGGIPNALKILAAHYHVTTGAMVKMISTGKVQSKEALPALVKGIEHGTKSTAALGGMMDKQSKTFQGAMSNISDSVTQALAKTFLPLFNSASKRANDLAKFLGSPAFTTFAHTVGHLVAQGFQLWGQVVDRLRPVLVDLFHQVVAAVPRVVAWVATLRPVFLSTFAAAKTIIGNVLSTLRNVLPVVLSVAGVFRDVLAAAWQRGVGLAKSLSGVLATIGAWMKDHQAQITGVAHAFANIGKALLPLAPYALGAFAAFKGVSAAASGVNALHDKVTGAIKSAKEWKDNLVQAKDAIVSVGTGAKKAVSTVGDWAKNAGSAASSAAGWAKSGLGVVASGIKVAATTVASTAAMVAQKVASLAIAAATKAWAAAQWLINAAMEANPLVLIASLIALVVGAIVLIGVKTGIFHRIWTAAWGGIKAVVHGVVGWFTGSVIPFFTNTIPNAFRRMGGWIRSAFNAVVGFMRTWGPVALAVLVPFIGIPLLIWQHFSAIKGFLGRVWSSAIHDIGGFVGQVGSAIGQIPGKIAAFGSAVFNAGAGLMGKLWGGIKSLASDAAGFAGDVISGIGQGIKDALNWVLHLPWTLPRIKIGAFGHYVTVGGDTIMPALAGGGLVTGPTMAMVGDNPGGKELVMPLDSKRTVSLLGKALAEAQAAKNTATALGAKAPLQVVGGRLDIAPDSAGKLRAWVRDVVLDEADLMATRQAMGFA